MSLITLVRHGQASYMAADYDRLSLLGEQQSRLLGEYWTRRRQIFDTVFTGPSKRHRHTGEIVAGVYREAGLNWPEPRVIPEMDEIDAFEMMKAMLPILLERNEEIRELDSQYRARQHTPEGGLYLERLFEEVARHWCTGEFDIPHVESWAHFRARVSRGITQIRELTGKSSRSVVFTSAGPIAATAGLALDLSPSATLDLLWVSRNSSYSEFLFNTRRFSLSVLNAVPHLDEASLLTYR